MALGAGMTVYSLGGLRVSTRIVAIVVLGVAALACVIAGYLIGEWRLEQEVRSAESHSRMGADVAAVQVATLQMRRHEKDFLLRRQERHVTASDAERSALQPILASLKANPEIQSQLELVAAIEDGLARYGVQFAALAATSRTIGLDENGGLLGRLRGSVHRVEKIVNDVANDGLLAKMLMMRRHEKDFQLRGDVKYLAELRKRREEFGGLLAQAPLSAEQKAELTTLMDAYVADVAALVEAEGLRARQTAQLSQIFAELEPRLASLAQFAQAEENEQKAAMAELRQQLHLWLPLFALAVLATLVVVGTLVARSITCPLRSLTAVMRLLAGGDKSVTVPYAEGRDEIGDMARAVEVLKRNALGIERMQAGQEALKRQAEAERRSTLNALGDGLERDVGGIVATISEKVAGILHSAEGMGGRIDHSTTRAIEVAEASARTNENVEAVAAATEELSASAQEISRQVAQSSDIARAAEAEAERTNEQVRGLSDAVGKIGDVVRMISDIANQTNLLALNATIEAARAGEAGKGFAVVAAEVKTLATQTGRATEQIGTQITSVQQATTRSVEALAVILVTLHRMSEGSGAIASANEEPGAATREIAARLREASTDAQMVNRSVTDITHASTASYAAAIQVMWSADDIDEPVQQLNGGMRSFMGAGRAGWGGAGVRGR